MKKELLVSILLQIIAVASMPFQVVIAMASLEISMVHVALVTGGVLRMAVLAMRVVGVYTTTAVTGTGTTTTSDTGFPLGV